MFIDDPQHKMNGFEFPAFAGNQAFNDQIGQFWQSNLMAQLANIIDKKSQYWRTKKFA